ncbi:MAG: EAL domain-containing protein [Polyangiaceae bacterium]
MFKLESDQALDGWPEVPVACQSAPLDYDTGIFLVARDGTRRAIRFALDTASPAEPQRVTVLFEDVTASNLTALRLQHLSEHDPLTGLLTRPHFIKLLEQQMTHSQRVQVLLYLNLNAFHLVNDTAGLAAGDALLCWVSGTLREVIGPSHACARLGSNEFGVLITSLTTDDCTQLAQELKQRLVEFRFAWRDRTYRIQSSIGLAKRSAGIDSASAWVSAAETACAQAARVGGNRALWQTGPSPTSRQHALEWVAHIKKNLRRGRVDLFCQPIVPLSDPYGKPAMEVLFRMLDSDGTPRSPQDVLLTAEHYGLMDSVDKYVVRETLRTLSSEPMLTEGVAHWSINLSATSLRQDTILDFIHTILAETGVAPTKVCFEITETAAVENLAEVRWLIQELRSIGCLLSLDDFGSGMASYAYLRDLSVDYIKIDRSFVKDVATSDLSAAITSSIHQIGVLLGARTVAEGVEDEETAAKLSEIGLDYAQGYFYGRPAPITALLR